MALVRLVADEIAGAARVRVIGPDGEVRVRRDDSRMSEGGVLVTPQSSTLQLIDVAPGAYAALVEPLGGAPRTYPFMIDPGDAEVRLETGREALARLDMGRWSHELARTVKLSRPALETPPPMARSPEPRPLQSLGPTDASESSRSTRGRRFSLGLSADTKPMRYGGWRPYDGPWATQVDWSVDEGGRRGLELTLARGGGPLVRTRKGAPGLEDGARVRLSVAVEGRRVQRAVIPLFVGGVRVTLRALSDDVQVDIQPVDPVKRALLRALSDGIGGEGLTIWSDFAMSESVESYVVGDLHEDPWIATVAALLAIRFESIDDKDVGRWAAILSERFPWIADCRVLRASATLREAGDDEAEQWNAAREALRELKAARRVGAPYFSFANTSLGDMLDALADSAVDERQRAEAATEVGRWRRHLPHRRDAGACFSWVTTGGARNFGSFDERYTRLIARGAAKDDLLSPAD